MSALPMRARGSEIIELRIEAIKNRYYFDYYPILENKEIIYISSYSVVTLLKSLTNRTVLSSAAFADAYLVLVNKGEELINRLPLNNLLLIRSHYPVLDKIVDWQKSYVEFASTSNLVVGTSMVFTAYHKGNDKPSGLSDLINLNIELIDLPIRNVSQVRFNFSEVLKLKDKRIRFIDFLSGIGSPNGYAETQSDVYKKAYLTLRTIKGIEIISNIPLIEINYYNQNSPNYINWNDEIIDFDKSYIQVPDTSNLVLNSAFVFNFHYLDNVSPKGRQRKEQTVS